MSPGSRVAAMDVILDTSKIAWRAPGGVMDGSITLAVDIAADAPHLFEILSTSAGQRGFWTADCDVDAQHARFGFPQAPVDLIADVTTEPGTLVRMSVTAG